MPATRFLSDDFGPPLPPGDSDRRTRKRSSDSRDGRNKRDRHRSRRSRSRSPSNDRSSSSRSSRRRRSRSSSRRRSSGSNSRRRRESRSSSRDRERHSPSRDRDRDTRRRRSPSRSESRRLSKERITITTDNSKDLDMRSVNMKPKAESTPRVTGKTKKNLLSSDPFGNESFDAFDSFGGENTKTTRQRKDSDTRMKNRKDSDTRRIALSTNPLAAEFKPAERVRKPPPEVNLSAPSLSLLCDPYGTPKKEAPKEALATSESSPDSNSSTSAPKDVPNIDLPHSFSNDSGEDDYDPANCAFSDDESEGTKSNPTNPLQRALNAFKEAPHSPRSSSSSMVMSPVTPPTEDEGSGNLKIDSGSLTDISPKPMSESGSNKPQAVVPPQKPEVQPMQSLLTSQLSQPSSSLFAPLQMPSRQPPVMSPAGGPDSSNTGLLSALQNISSIQNQPVLNIVQNLSEIKNQLNLNKSLHDMFALQEQEDKRKTKKSKKSSSGKRETFKKRKDFQRAVVLCSKESIKPFYKNKRIDKDQYKKIMKDCVSKIVHSSKSYTLDKDKVAQTIEKYVNKYSSKKARF